MVRLARLVTLGMMVVAVACSKKSAPNDAALSAAAAAEDLVALRSALALHPSPEALTEALVGAAGHGRLNATRELLAAGANPARASVEMGGIKPLLLASYGGHANVVQELLAKGAPADSENSDRETALMVCGACERAAVPECDRGCAEIAKALIAAGAKVNARDKHGRDVIGAQAFVGHAEVVEQLLAAGAATDQADDDGQTPLFQAAIGGDVPTVQSLLRHHAAVDASNKLGATPLLAAVSKSFPPVVVALLDAGAKIELRAPNGMNALHTAAAAEKEEAEITRALLAHGADKDATVDSGDAFNGMTAISFATMRGSTKVAALLLEAGADLAKGPPRTAPPLILAAAVGNLELVKSYLAHGARLEQTNPQGGTALRAAADGGKNEVVQLLLSKGANPRPRDTFGKLPIDYARENKHDAVVALLARAP